MKNRILFISLFILFIFKGFTQADSSGIAIVKIDKDYFKSCLTDSRDVLISPVRWKAGAWIGASAVCITTGILITQDKIIRKFFVRNESQLTQNMSDYFFDPMGNGLLCLPALGILYGCGAIWENGQAKGTALKGLEAFVITGIVTTAIKQITHRHRPYQDDPPDPLNWDGPFSLVKYNSFPSGHASAIFAVATVIACSYNETIWVPVLCYSVAGLTAIARLAVNKHWASDVLFGSALGFGIGKLVYNNTGKKLKIIPAGENGLGMTFLYSL